MLFRQLFDSDTSTYTYLLADPETREAILIDPVKEQADRDAQVLDELGLRLVATIETHVHADHVTGAWALKQRYGQDIVYPATSGATGADRYVNEGDAIAFGKHAVMVRLTPGHTAGCATYVTEDLSRAFTGDALLIRGSGRTDFQQGDSRQLWASVHDQIFSLPDETQLYPGHDYKGRTVSTVAEEKAHNPRLGGTRTVSDFVQIMENLNLSYPRHIDRALPANLALGREDGDGEAAAAPTDLWASIPRSPAGVRHVTPDWVRKYKNEVRIIDVRELSEWNDHLGHLDEAELVPLGTLADAAGKWNLDEHLVLICRSSGRSDRAALALEKAGFKYVASMVGGMLAFRNSETTGATAGSCG
ncbi:MAG: MBL fold metallo-hydrolase [Deltaproteobacteria bacterium]|nr:MAG: MBL fold metallo-hydrolase [Deltaproteobacteria bacterium]